MSRKTKTLDDRYVIDLRQPMRTGGMAEVARARDIVGNRDVAIKMFRRGFVGDRFSAAAFSRETKSLQAVDHPHIVKVLDVGTDPEDERRYLVFEWMEANLEDHLVANPLDGWDDYYEQVGGPIIDALCHAFGRHIVHRDLKPANILVDHDGVVRLTDFGIAKFRNAVQPEITLAGFRSVPFSPPESSDGAFSDSRDVYGFGVLTLRCLTNRKLVTYDDVYEVLQEVDLPDPVYRVIARCIDKEPEKRFQNILELQVQLGSIQEARQQAWIQTPVHYVRFRPKALEQIGADYKHLDSARLSRVLLEDLHESLSIVSAPASQSAGKKPPPGQRLELFGARYSYNAFVDQREPDHIEIQSIGRPNPGLLEMRRIDSWQPKIELRLGRPLPGANGRQLVVRFLAQLAAHEELTAVKRAQEAHERVFRVWQQLLNAQDAVERSQRRSISFISAEVIGSRIEFVVAAGESDTELVGQPWTVSLPGGGTIAGEVESISDSRLVLWIDSGRADAVPTRGELRFDTRASRKALDKQRAALDAIRFARSVRTDLKGLLANPQTSAEPQRIEVTEFFQSDLDQDKREIVGTSLGSPDFLLVEGPPGTGKTRLITEVILQALRRAPHSRVLLSSQTHVALDNALERVGAIDPDLKIVRIGNRLDPRIAESVRPLLLSTQVEEWLRQVAKKSSAFITAWAEAHGIDRQDVDLGMAVSRYKLALECELRVRGQIAGVEQELGALQSDVAASETSGNGGTYQELQERIKQREEHLDSLRHEHTRAAARVVAAKRTLAQTGAHGPELSRQRELQELEEWEEGLLNHSATTRRCKQLIELGEEWELRFGKSSDFHGALLADAQVVAGTCVGFMGARGIQEIEFDLCIIDEASKATATELLVPLSRSRSWMLVGDRNQLPPFTQRALESPALLEDYGLAEDDIKSTILDYLVAALPASCQSALTHQHRMCAPIGNLVSSCFYDGRLETVRDSNGLPIDALPRPVTWFSTSALQERHEQRVKPSHKNILEVKESLKFLRRLNFFSKARKARRSVVFLTGYGAQRTEFERSFAAVRAELEWLDVTANTVDAFQGREADVVIYSVTRSNKEGELGFLSERKRLNVALSRARDGLAIFGDHVFCSSVRGQSPFIDVLQHIRSHGDECALEELLA